MTQGSYTQPLGLVSETNPGSASLSSALMLLQNEVCKSPGLADVGQLVRAHS